MEQQNSPCNLFLVKSISLSNKTQYRFMEQTGFGKYLKCCFEKQAFLRYHIKVIPKKGNAI